MAIIDRAKPSHLGLAAGIAFLLASAGCSGGGGSTSGGAIEGLAGPGQVVVVAPEGAGGGNPATGAGGVAPGSNAFPAGSDYVTDSAHTYIYDPSMENLETINSILCQTSMTAYAQMVNEGPYKAQIDVSLCETGNDQDSGGSGSGQTSAGASEIEIFTVDCQRPTRTAAQTVHFWVPGGEGGPAATIFAEMILARAASATDPFGSFELCFADVLDVGGDILNPDMWGVLETNVATPGMLGFSFYNEHGDINAVPAPNEYAQIAQVTVEMSQDQESGSARIRTQQRYDFGGGDSGIQDSEWVLAFDANHIKRQLDANPVVVLSRTSYDTQAWRYNLYHNEGAELGERVQLNSGFGFRTEDGDYGWIGYHGMWLPDGVSLESGDTIQRDVWGETEGESFTLVKAPGKLIRNERNTMDLSDLAGQTFRWWDHNSGTQFLLEYSAGDWWELATWNDSTHEWDQLPNPVVLDVVEDGGGWLGMWSGTLGGSVNFVDGDTFITYFEQTNVNSADALFDGTNGTVSLFGYFQCLDFELTGTEVENGAVYLPNVNDVNTPHEYLFDASDLTLYFDNPGDQLRQVGLAAGQAPTSGPNMWGMNSGPMVTNTNALGDIWDIWNVDVFYTYETGHNAWNQYSTVLDSESQAVAFDPPLQFLYTHSQANDRNDDASHDGQLFFLEYGGPGNLHGIPHEGVDIDGDNEPDRWYPEFSIADGVVMGPDGTEYALRAIEMEQSLQEDPDGGAGLDLATALGLTLPDGSNYQTPQNGAKPVVPGPPAVIDGVVQGAQD
jgi:hypothetical protein